MILFMFLTNEALADIKYICDVDDKIYSQNVSKITLIDGLLFTNDKVFSTNNCVINMTNANVGCVGMKSFSSMKMVRIGSSYNFYYFDENVEVYTKINISNICQIN